MANSLRYKKLWSGLTRLRRFWQQWQRNELLKAVFAIFLLVLLSAVAISFVERSINKQFDHVGAGLWWAVVTMTTCGYGDLVPVTLGGRLIAALVMIAGVVLLSVFTAAVSSSVITRRMMEGRGLSKLKMKNHIVLLGWNSGANAVIDAISSNLISANRSLALVNQLSSDAVEQVIARRHDLHMKYVYGDFTEEAVLERANVVAAAAVIIVPDESNTARPKSDERTILATLSVKAMAPKIKVIAHIMDPQNEGHLERANADEIVISDRYSGYLLGAHLTAPGIPAMVDLLLNNSSTVHLERQKLPHVLIGKTFAQAIEYFHKQNTGLLLGFVQDEAGFKLDDILSEDVSAIDQFIREKLQAAGKGLGKRSGTSVNLLPDGHYVIVDKDVPVLLAKTV
jgi:voltage-gated potassium channel